MSEMEEYSIIYRFYEYDVIFLPSLFSNDNNVKIITISIN